MRTLYLWRCRECSAQLVPAGSRVTDRAVLGRVGVVCAVCGVVAGESPVEHWTLSPGLVSFRANTVRGDDYTLVLEKTWEPTLLPG